jgi:integrase
VTFGDGCAAYLAHVEAEGRSPTTIRDYRNSIRSRLTPALGAETPIAQITAENVEELRAELLEQVSRRTAQKLLTILGGVFKLAKRKGWVGQNPMAGVDPVKIKRSGDFNVLAVPTQLDRVLDAATDELTRASIAIAGYAGLRAGEVRALRWRDVDVDSALIHVRRNRPSGCGDILPKGKTVRSVPLMDGAADALAALRRVSPFTAETDYVFTRNGTVPVGSNTLREEFYAAMEAAGIDRTAFPLKPGFRFHDLRHTYGTWAVQVWPLVDVQAYMGHSDIQTTMLYAHHVPKVNAARSGNEYMRSQRQGAESPEPPLSRREQIAKMRRELDELETQESESLAPVLPTGRRSHEPREGRTTVLASGRLRG